MVKCTEGETSRSSAKLGCGQTGVGEGGYRLLCLWPIALRSEMLGGCVVH